MQAPKWLTRTVATTLAVSILALPHAARAQAAAAAPAAPAVNPALLALQPGAVVRRVVMKDATSAESFRQKLETFKNTGLFRDSIPGSDPKKPITIEISFLVSGNYLLVCGSREWVDANIETIRLMGYLFERPRAHLQLNLRVVQLTGPANADVIQMTETVRALVDAQRDEVVRTFSDLEDYLMRRLRQRSSSDQAVLAAVRSLLPELGVGDRPLSVPEILLLLMLDRASPAPQVASSQEGAASSATEQALLALPQALGNALEDPHHDEAKVAAEVQDEVTTWKQAVTAARDWCAQYGEELKKAKDNTILSTFSQALQQPNCPLPSWLSRRMQRSLETTERLYPNLVRKHTQNSLDQLQRRFTSALDRVAQIETTLTSGQAPTAVTTVAQTKDGQPAPAVPMGNVGRNLLALKSVAEEMVPAPLAMFEAVALATDNAAPTPEQIIQMFREYTDERRNVEMLLGDMPVGNTPPRAPNYAKMQTLEASLNLWLRRVAEAMSRSLEQQFYKRYVNELRLMANKQLGKTSDRNLLDDANLDQIPDITRDVLLADTGVNIFVSNSISLQFAPETMNSVSAQVQASLPSKQNLQERIAQASTAANQLNALQSAFGINGESMVKALLSGGQAVPVQDGINLSAMPTIGFDAGTVTLTLTANQTLQANNDKVADRVTNHSINNATVTALSYEPMVLSTLASNISYFENTGGIPVLRKAPILKDLLGDIPFKPFKEGKRQKGVYQSSVIILEPVVIPTIEDMVRYHSGWRTGQTATTVAVPNDLDAPGALPTPGAVKAAVAAGTAPAAAPMPMPAPAAPAPAAPAPAGK